MYVVIFFFGGFERINHMNKMNQMRKEFIQIMIKILLLSNFFFVININKREREIFYHIEVIK